MISRRGFLLGAGAIAVVAQTMPLARAVEWAETKLVAEPELVVVRHIGRIVRVAGSGLYGDGLIVAAPGQAVPDWVLTGGHYGHTVYPREPMRAALESLRVSGAERVYVPDFMRRAAEIRGLAAEDPELAAVLEFARSSVSGSGRRIITL